jgi:hypothetical protein
VSSRPCIVAALLAVSLAACQPVPQPFSHDATGDTAVLDLPDSGGIVVLEPAEAPPATAAALAQAMVAALAARNVPAGTGSGNSQSHFLQGFVEDDGRDAAIFWTLYNPQGTVVETIRQSIEGTPVTAWAAAEPALMRRLAEAAAPQIAALVQDASPDENPLPALRLGEVTGASEAGNRQLRNALQRYLRTTGLRIADTPGPHTVGIAGSVTVDPPQAGQQRVTLDWRVNDAEGVEIGRISQANPVPAGSLDDGWGAIADLAARAAAEGIEALIRQVDWRARDAGNPPPGHSRKIRRPGPPLAGLHGVARLIGSRPARLPPWPAGSLSSLSGPAAWSPGRKYRATGISPGVGR